MSSDFNDQTNELDDLENTEISKSERKRQAHRVLDFARELVESSSAQLGDMPIPDPIRAMIAETRAMHSRGARKRQLAFLAKHLRDLPEDELLAMTEHADKKQQQMLRENARMHLLENWRQALLERPESLTALLEHVHEDRRNDLGQRVRQVRSNQKKGNPRGFRELFRLLREIDAETPLPPCR